MHKYIRLSANFNEFHKFNLKVDKQFNQIKISQVPIFQQTLTNHHQSLRSKGYQGCIFRPPKLRGFQWAFVSQNPEAPKPRQHLRPANARGGTTHPTGNLNFNGGYINLFYMHTYLSLCICISIGFVSLFEVHDDLYDMFFFLFARASAKDLPYK